MRPGQLMLRVGWLGTYVQTQHDDFDDVVGQGNIPIIHDQDLAIGEARLALDVGLTERFAASLLVPVRVVSTSIVYRDGRGMPVQLTTPSTHHRDETLTGIVDPTVLGAFSYSLAGVRLTVRAGVSIPLGRTEEDPFTLGEMGERHQHIQMGTGTFNPVLAVEASRRFGEWRLGAFAFTQQVVYENSKGFHAGDRYAAGLSLAHPLGKRWSLRGGPEVQGETAERWNGVRHTDEGNQGRIDAILGAVLAWNIAPALTLDLAVKVPVYTHVVGGQLDVPAIVEVGASWSFGGAARPAAAEEGDEHGHDHAHGDGHDHAHGDEHEHEHGHDEHGQSDEHDHDEHSDEHGKDADGDAHADHKPAPADHKPAHAALDTTGADVADVGKNGERVALVPVAGKLTIFDFWAEWCEPCKNLEPVLVELARAHPDRVAIRRVEVIDWDSPVAEQHLTPGGFGLPHLKVFDARGKLVLERSSAPGQLEALIEAVRRLVTPPAAAPKQAVRPKPLVIPVAVTAKGFEPRDFQVPRGKPVVLRFERTEAKTCATEVVFDHDGTRVVKDLPLGKVVDLAITFTKPGAIRYGCAMNKMVGGTITVR